MTDLPAPDKQDIVTDLKYITFRRDVVLENFNEKLKSHLLTDEELHKKLDSVLRINKQIKMMEDVLVVSRITEANKKKG